MGTTDELNKSAAHNILAFHPVALLIALRPLQWIKNGLVFLPFMFSVRLAWSLDNLEPVPELIVRLVVVFVAFCAMGGAVYLLNDVADREGDRQHPTKRQRPIASGRVSVPVALAGALIIGIGGVLVLAVLEPVLGGMGLLYVVINVAYSLGAKRIVLVDVLAVASGYVIRAVAGAVAIDVVASPWLYVTTGAGALFIVLGRRYAEVRQAGDDAYEQRSVLRSYAGPLIGQLLTISATAAWLSYTLYTVEATNLPRNNTMLLTLPLVTLGLFRYLYLLNTSREAEAPEHLIVRDIPLVLSILGWLAVSAAVLLLSP